MNVSQSIKQSFSSSILTLKTRRGMMHIIIFTLALVAFEAFNFSTTDFALSDLLGDLRFAGVRWATLLSIAFCGIDFAGIARLFTPQTGEEEPRSMWFMFGAWFLAGTVNAILTWWGVVMAMQTHQVISAGVVDAAFITKVVPIFIALMVWVIRILLVGTLSKKGEQLLGEASQQTKGGLSRREYRQAQSRAAQVPAKPVSVTGFSRAVAAKNSTPSHGFRPEPSYIPLQDEVAYRSLKSNRSGQRRV